MYLGVDLTVENILNVKSKTFLNFINHNRPFVMVWLKYTP